MEAFNFTAASEDCNLYTYDMRKLQSATCVHKVGIVVWWFELISNSMVCCYWRMQMATVCRQHMFCAGNSGVRMAAAATASVGSSNCRQRQQ
jgi:hypothetical protein